MWVLIIIALLLVARLAYLASLEGKFQISESIEINADVQRCRSTIIDFKSWPNWSPWLMHEPDCPLIYSDNFDQEGGSYAWDGKHIGAGNMVQLKQQALELNMQVNFTRPFKSSSNVNFHLAPTSNGTKVTWTMDSSMPFLFRPMVKMIKQGISMDYRIGLAKLKGMLEPEANQPKFNFVGRTQFAAVDAEFQHFKGNLDDIGPVMDKAYAQLNQQFSDQIKGPFRFAAYYKSDIKHRVVDCDIAMPVTQASSSSKRYGDDGKYYQLTFTGGYNFAELAWYSVFANMRMLKIKVDKSRAMLEIYDNDPADVAEKDLITRILIPIK